MNKHLETGAGLIDVPANFLAVFALDVSIFTALALFLAVGGRHG